MVWIDLVCIDNSTVSRMRFVNNRVSYWTAIICHCHNVQKSDMNCGLIHDLIYPTNQSTPPSSSERAHRHDRTRCEVVNASPSWKKRGSTMTTLEANQEAAAMLLCNKQRSLCDLFKESFQEHTPYFQLQFWRCLVLLGTSFSLACMWLLSNAKNGGCSSERQCRRQDEILWITSPRMAPFLDAFRESLSGMHRVSKKLSYDATRSS